MGTRLHMSLNEIYVTEATLSVAEFQHAGDVTYHRDAAPWARS